MNILKIGDVIEITKLGRSTIYAWVKTGDYLPQIKLGLRSSSWIEEEILKWIQDRIDKREYGIN